MAPYVPVPPKPEWFTDKEAITNTRAEQKHNSNPTSRSRREKGGGEENGR
eukprot:CAMPEP_0182544346 /NCGR_PEP_ID=MMETSP1323-20130603/32995_1 /TAXON_ID=236787 /ORGANISM="Florenciella parvula, Strain RCC1693" /LENGTH=49 /DNA_ID= /DNA_START= /DNA_END= /DNA_ORIENTATION=